MNELYTIIDGLSKVGFTGLLVILAVPKLRKQVFGNGNDKDIFKQISNDNHHEIINKLDEIHKALLADREKSVERHYEILEKIK